MDKNLNAIEILAYSTVRIETVQNDGNIGTGTGFFYNINVDGKSVPVIFTNKHVIKDANEGILVLTLKDQNGNPKLSNYDKFHIGDFEQLWIPHSDPEIDICAMPIGPLLNLAQKEGKKFFYTTFDKSIIPTQEEIEDYPGIEEITMIGYPNGIWDEKNNFPVFRKGITATNPKYNWNGKEEFLIDAACFPGSSGSPILLLDLKSYVKKNVVVMGTRIKLLGILYGGFQHTVTGEIQIINVPTHNKPITISSIPNNLGIAIKSQILLEFDNIIADFVKAKNNKRV